MPTCVQDSWTYGFVPRYTGQFTLGGLRNQVLAGLRFFGGNNDARQCINVNGNNYEAYLEDRIYVSPTVTLMAGAKAYRSRRNYTDSTADCKRTPRPRPMEPATSSSAAC
ncbi:hypothetical protein D9M68_115510 [compost metagenome]